MKMKLSLCCFLLIALAPALVRSQETATSPPAIELSYGTFVGANDGKIIQFLGMPFAQAPAGDLRFRRSEPPLPSTEIYNATVEGAACPQLAFTIPPELGQLPGRTYDSISEDCLTVNVIKPSSHDGLLPVFFWIHGGGFETGHAMDNAIGILVERSVEVGMPIMVVSANHRLNAFGFLAGDEVLAQGVANLGIHDQIFALEWTQQYVEQFGGDPTKVIISGASAGAISSAVLMLTRADNKTSSDLFRGAFMISGAPTTTTTVQSGQQSFEQLLALTSCGDLDCLRGVPFDALVTAVNQTTNLFSYSSLGNEWRPRVDGDLIPVDPMCAVAQGNYMKVPFISGNSDDEGTLFSFSNANVTTDEEFKEYIRTYYFNNATDKEIDQLATEYPQDPEKGSPFDTGNNNTLTPQFKRLAAIQGDTVFQVPRRFFLETASKTQNTWGSLSKRGKATPFLGAVHGSDTFFWFPTNTTAPDYTGTDMIIRFIHTLDPNPDGEEQWPRYDSCERSLLTLVDDDRQPTIITVDDYRFSAMEAVRNLLLELGKRGRKR